MAQSCSGRIRCRTRTYGLAPDRIFRRTRLCGTRRHNRSGCRRDGPACRHTDESARHSLVGLPGRDLVDQTIGARLGLPQLGKIRRVHPLREVRGFGRGEIAVGDALQQGHRSFPSVRSCGRALDFPRPVHVKSLGSGLPRIPTRTPPAPPRSHDRAPALSDIDPDLGPSQRLDALSLSGNA
jgi:hypothetical protein